LAGSSVSLSMRIAVVDESSLILDLLREALEGAGYSVTCARDVHEAVRAEGEMLLADPTWLTRLPALDKLRVLEKEHGLGEGLRRAIGDVRQQDALPSLVARYRPRFVATARRRLGRAVDLFDDARGEGLRELARELHRLAGEAQLLELHDFADLALTGEMFALRWAANDNFEELLGCASCLNGLCQALSQLTPMAAA
jgi:hypothetical protein